jgi:hypothetical protein
VAELASTNEIKTVVVGDKVFIISEHFIERFKERSPTNTIHDFYDFIAKALASAKVVHSSESGRGVIILLKHKCEECWYYFDMNNDLVYVVNENRNGKIQADFFIRSCYRISKSDWAKRLAIKRNWSNNGSRRNKNRR